MEKRKPTRGEMQQLIVTLGPVIASRMEEMKGRKPSEVVSLLRGLMSEHIAAMVRSEELADLDWPPLAFDHDEIGQRIKVGFKEEPPEETPEEVEARVKSTARALWDMVRDAITDLDTKKRPPSCSSVSMGIAIFGALVASGMDRSEALAGAAWQVLTHHCIDGEPETAPKYTH